MRQNMWFQHDDPAHYSMVVRKLLDHDFGGHWIGGAGPVNWPVRLPDLSSPDFFLWVYLKDKQEPTTCGNMIEPIRNSSRHMSQ